MAAGRILWTWWSLINKHCVSALPDGLWCYILLGPPMVPFCPNGAFLSTGWVCCGQAEGPMGEKGEDPRAYKPDGTKVSEVRKNKGIEGKKELAFQISLFSLMQSPAWRSIINTFSFLKKNRVLGFRVLWYLGNAPGALQEAGSQSPITSKDITDYTMNYIDLYILLHWWIHVLFKHTWIFIKTLELLDSQYSLTTMQ